MAIQGPSGGTDPGLGRTPSELPERTIPHDQGPQGSEFNPNDHIWDGETWWSRDRQYRWDGAGWRSIGGDRSVGAAGGAIGLGCSSMAIALIALAGSGACLSTRETPEFALLIGCIAVLVALAAGVWTLVRRGHPALYLFTVAGVLASLPAIVVGVHGGCS